MLILVGQKIWNTCHNTVNRAFTGCQHDTDSTWGTCMVSLEGYVTLTTSNSFGEVGVGNPCSLSSVPAIIPLAVIFSIFPLHQNKYKGYNLLHVIIWRQAYLHVIVFNQPRMLCGSWWFTFLFASVASGLGEVKVACTPYEKETSLILYFLYLFTLIVEIGMGVKYPSYCIVVVSQMSSWCYLKNTMQ